LHERLKALLFGVVGSFALFALYIIIPPIGIFSGMLTAFPISYNRLIYGRTSMLGVLLGTTAAVSASFGIISGCIYLCTCGVVGVVLPELLLKDFGGSRALFWTVLANGLVFATAFVVYTAVSGDNLHSQITASMAISTKQAIAIYEKAGIKGEDLDLLKSSMDTGAALVSKLYPALLTVLMILIAGCNLALVKKMVIKRSLNISIGDFRNFRNSEMLVWVLITDGLALLLPESVITTPALNALIIISLCYFFQGMAVVATFATKTAVPSAVRILLYALLIIQPYLLALIAGIGLFDLWVDFRTPKTQENL
jgi:uncharacterized protein YybS (DUF2232 family)